MIHYNRCNANFVGKNMEPIHQLATTAQAATMANIKADSISSLIARGVMPKPDAYVGKTAVWHLDTIIEWLQLRPGPQGKWGDNLPEGNPEATQAILNHYLTADQAGQLLNTAPRNIQDRARRGTLPAPVARLGNSWVWKKSDFDQHLPG